MHDDVSSKLQTVDCRRIDNATLKYRVAITCKNMQMLMLRVMKLRTEFVLSIDVSKIKKTIFFSIAFARKLEAES